MRLEGLSQPPFDTTMMGVFSGALAYHGLGRGAAEVFGGSGHAFVMNIHKQLCPSGPYCFDPSGVFALARNLGLDVDDLGFFHAGSSPDERAAVEARLRQELDAATPCSLVNMDHQLILGYDEEGFHTAQPWPSVEHYPPATFSFGSWSEMGEEVHVNFYALRRGEPVDDRTALLESLRFAVDLYRHGDRYADPDYGLGPVAYAYWQDAIAEHGQSHGNWWNASVWSECRRRAAEYLAASAAALPEAGERLQQLSADYAAIGERLAGAADRDLPLDRKRPLIAEAAQREADAVTGIESLLASIDR